MLTETVPTNNAVSIARRATRQPHLVATLVACVCVLGSANDAFSQSDFTETENPAGQGGRSVPAPWRPSFDPVNGGTDEQSGTANLAEPLEATGAPQDRSPDVVGAAASVPTEDDPRAVVNADNPDQPLQRGQGQDARSASITRVSKSMSRLPSEAGQIWREYDITPYTSKITSVDNPQQAIIDWILHETGTEMWFSQPLGILNADRDQLRVYHTPEIQRVVHRIVDRFVNTRGQIQEVQVNLVTVANPNWRETAYTMLQPIEVQSPGVEAWMITKENAAQLLAQLRRRPDFKEHGTGRISHHDGQTVSLKNTHPVQFVRNLRWVPNSAPGYQPLMTNIDEGYALDISSLSSIDGKTIDATIKAAVDQVERLNTVRVIVAGAGGTTDRVNLQIPELVSWRMQERFRWPNDQVLLLSCGVVASPEPKTRRSGGGLPALLGGAIRQRADALLFIEYRGPQLPGNMPPRASQSLPMSTPLTVPQRR